MTAHSQILAMTLIAIAGYGVICAGLMWALRWRR